MAGNDKRSKDKEKSKEASNRRTQTLLVVAVLVLTVILVVVLQGVFRLDDTATLLVATLVIAAAAFTITYLLIVSRRSEIRSDHRKTCEPILRRYRQSGNASQLMAEYNQWSHKPHQPKLVYDFTKETVEEFMASGNYGYAKRQLKAMAKMPTTDRTRMEFEQYRKECLKRIEKGAC